MKMQYQMSKDVGSIFVKVFIVILIIATIGVVGYGHIRDTKIIEQNKAIAGELNKQSDKETQDQDNAALPQLKYEGKKWLAIGDSITSNNQYQNAVAALCKISKVTTDAAPEQKLGTMADRLTKENLADVDLITIFGGTYDYSGGKLLGLKTDDKSVDKFYGNIRKIIDKIQSLNPNTKIVFITPLKRGKYKNEPVYPAPNSVGNKLEQYVQAIKFVCKEKSIQVIDLFDNSGINENNLSQYTIDNLNPNAAVYDKISKVIADELENK
jgi:lysophospholipase L1-like esterase